MVPVAGVVAAAVVAVVAQYHPLGAARAGGVISALVLLATGVMLLLNARGRDDRLAIRLLAAAMVVLALSQALVAGYVGDHTVAYPTAGDDVGVLSVGLFFAALVVGTRGRSRSIDLMRVALDALLLGLSAALLVWRLVLKDELFVDSVAHGVSVSAMSMIMIDCALLAMLALLWLRELETGLLLATLGMALVTTCDVLVVRAVGDPGGRWPWQVGVLSCVAFSLVAAAALRYLPQRSLRQWTVGDEAGARADVRVTVATTLASLALLGGANVTVLRESAGVDRTTATLTMLVVVVFAAREVVGGVLRRSMLRGLTTLAFRDPLTSLGNRRALALRHQSLAGTGVTSLLTLDLDGFKEVNDVLGHARGDALLVSVAEQVAGCLPPDVEAFRIGGDEFAVVVPGDPERALAVAEHLLCAVRSASLSVPGAEVMNVSASIGVAALGPVSPDAGRGPRPSRHGPEAPDVLRALVESGVALRAAKAAGRDRVELFDGPVAAGHRRNQLVERRLRESIDEGTVVPHYQPVVDLRTRAVVGFEALARWDDEVLGRVGPDEFIPVAERCGLVTELGAAVLRRAVRDVVDMHEQHPDLGPLRMAVNCSAVQLRRAGYADTVLSECAAAGLSPEHLIVEVTESLLIDPGDPALRQLALLRDMGVNVAIDDFGSGYSSLAYLTRMPANILKLDRELVSRVVDDPRARHIISSIIGLAGGLQMDVVMEGVETTEVHEVVSDAGGGFGQGWLYGAAAPTSEVIALVRRINAAALLPLGRR